MSERVRITITIDLDTKEGETAEELIEYLNDDAHDRKKLGYNPGVVQSPSPICYFSNTTEWLKDRNVRWWPRRYKTLKHQARKIRR